MIKEIQPDTKLPKPKKIKIYTAVISQSGTGAPTATILQNTLGPVIWARTSAGEYTATLSVPIIGLCAIFTTGSIDPELVFATQQDATVILLKNRNSSFTFVDNFTNYIIEIRTYNNI